VIDFARLNHSTISFFNLPESAASRWNRVKLNASKVSLFFSIDFFFCVIRILYGTCTFCWKLFFLLPFVPFDTKVMFDSEVNCFLQVGKGLFLDAKAQKLAFQHWIEAVSMHFLTLHIGII